MKKWIGNCEMRKNEKVNILRFPEKYRENEKVLSESKKNIK